MLDKTFLKRYIVGFHERDFSGIIPRELRVEAIPNRATVIIGPRRAGKTYYLLSLVDKENPERYLYVDFEHPIFHPMTPTDFLAVLDAYHELYPKIKHPIVMLDEVQAVPDWERIVRYLLDGGYTVYITGSSSKLLSREVATHLRGRSLTYTLLPLSFREFLRFKRVDYRGRDFYRNYTQISRLLEEYLHYGAYPEVALSSEGVKDNILKDYLDVLIKKDVLERHRIKNIHLLNELLYFSLHSYSKYVSFDSLYRLFKGRLKVTKRTIANYFSYLEEAFALFLVRKYERSPKARIVAPRKLYLIDTGLSIFGSKDLGRDMENVVFLELLRRTSGNPAMKVTYWKSSQGHEVDFVISEHGRVNELIQVSVKTIDEKTRRRELLALLHASEKLGCEKLTLITLDEEGIEDISLYGMKGRVKMVPLVKWLLGLSTGFEE
ncbi:ATPase [Thermococcus sp. EP1]|uniref:ATP-binding protein n=1 Tax=Thermococcus sp. EP1 TaxID=1591054 RepID=UPI0006DB67C8|nr:ATP-binding protein [Thermococcus sp. EP1]KPU63597.1 ATPase [Thermococcus sp. EP1]